MKNLKKKKIMVVIDLWNSPHTVQVTKKDTMGTCKRRLKRISHFCRPIYQEQKDCGTLELEERTSVPRNMHRWYC